MYEDLPECPPDMEPLKKKKKRSEISEPARKQQKKQRTLRSSDLATYSEPRTSKASKSSRPSASMQTEQVNASSPPSSEPTQTQHSDIQPIIICDSPTQPTPTESHNPPPTIVIPISYAPQEQNPNSIVSEPPQETSSPPTSPNIIPPTQNQPIDSEVTLSDYSPVYSSDFVFPDLKSPTIQSAAPIQTLTSAQVVEVIASEPNPEPVVSESSNPTSSEAMFSEPNNSEHLSESGAFVISTSDSPQPENQTLVPFNPVPSNLSECISLFNAHAQKKISEISESTASSLRPLDLEADWTQFQEWMSSESQKIFEFSTVSKDEGIQIVIARRNAKIVEMAERRRAAEQREAERVRQAALEAERIEKEKAEAIRLEAARSEAAGPETESSQGRKEPETSGMLVISDPRIDTLEKTLSSMHAEQQALKQSFDKQDEVNANMQNLLSQILAKISSPNP